jgi:hypothetical protein
MSSLMMTMNARSAVAPAAHNAWITLTDPPRRNQRPAMRLLRGFIDVAEDSTVYPVRRFVPVGDIEVL